MRSISIAVFTTALLATGCSGFVTVGTRPTIDPSWFTNPVQFIRRTSLDAARETFSGERTVAGFDGATVDAVAGSCGVHDGSAATSGDAMGLSARFDRIGSHLTTVIQELEALKTEVPGFSIEALVFPIHDVEAVRRRLANIKKTLTATTGAAS